ncbi:MAG: DUF4352 domain-containing protein [Bryobacteraceae bacterium]
MPAILLFSGCGDSSMEASHIGTFAMGERVQIGPLTYVVNETDWRHQMGQGAAASTPDNRFLFVNLSISNKGSQPVSLPLTVLHDAKGETHTELTENLTDVSEWLGLFRTVEPGATAQGYVIFDVPMGAYKLQVSDGGDIGAEKTALIEIPAQVPVPIQ